VGVLTACNKKTAEEKSNISRTVSSFYVGESENYAVQVEFGKREAMFVADGKATDVNDFCELTVQPLKVNNGEPMTFTVNAEGQTLGGELAQDPLGEYKSAIALEFAPASLTLTHGETSETIDLQDILADKLTSEDVINIAKEQFADNIASATADGGKLNREIYVKIIPGRARENYYYFVAFIGEDVNYWALLIDPASGAVLSSRS
jgi:hypothetical protein